METDTYYNYFRDYDPTLGRYVQRDPIGLGDGWNVYVYAHGNAIVFIDPSGRSVCRVMPVALVDLLGAQ
ncbi:MAG: RHS repeat-associated core domain-containing protein [Pseudomonadales bacterium]|nr:RHS repeat-associated core domain-containing protein [Pseudomonadales bacterium]